MRTVNCTNKLFSVLVHPSLATVRGWQPDAQLLFTANLQALGALHGADPAPGNDLVRGQPDAL